MRIAECNGTATSDACFASPVRDPAAQECRVARETTINA